MDRYAVVRHPGDGWFVIRVGSSDQESLLARANAIVTFDLDQAYAVADGLNDAEERGQVPVRDPFGNYVARIATSDALSLLRCGVLDDDFRIRPDSRLTLSVESAHNERHRRLAIGPSLAAIVAAAAERAEA